MKSSRHVSTVAFTGTSCQGKVLSALIAERVGCGEDEIDVFKQTGDKIYPDDFVSASTFVEVTRRAQELDPKKRPPPKPRPKMASAGGGEMSAIDHMSGVSEEDRIRMLQHNVGSHTGASERFGRPQFRRQNTETIDSRKPPPPGYVCHGCGKSGHYIEHCPNGRIGERPKTISAPIGIPESMLEECPVDYDGPKYVTRDGRLVRRIVDKHSYVTGVDFCADDADEEDEPPAAAGGAYGAPTAARVKLPTHLTCPACTALVKEAMLLPCCNRGICKICLERTMQLAMASDDPPSCPACDELLLMDDVEVAEALREEARQVKANTAAAGGDRKRPREADEDGEDQGQ